MGIKFTLHVEGLQEARNALLELPKATGRNVVKRALIEAAEPLEKEAERLAPVFRGHLKRSITIGTKQTKRSKVGKQSEVEIYLGPSDVPQAMKQEFGTVHHAPQPFMRPTWDSHSMKAIYTITKILESQIEKARARLARKAARLAAKK